MSHSVFLKNMRSHPRLWKESLRGGDEEEEEEEGT